MFVNDYILLIMNCEKYSEKAQKQKESWIKDLPKQMIYFHVLGNPALETEYVFDEIKRILWVKTLDDYVSLPKKVIAAFAAINKTYKFKYIFKTDDDQNLNDNTFFDTLINQIQVKKLKPHYGGQIVDVKIPYLSQYYELHPELPNDMIIQKTEYCSGRFYFLSSESVSNLISKRENIDNEFLEDYAIGLFLNPIFKKVMIPILSADYFTDML